VDAGQTLASRSPSLEAGYISALTSMSFTRYQQR
jgi:hypothetical protein